MAWGQIAGQWQEFKGKVKEQWGKLTADDLGVIEGQRDQLSGRLQKRYGYTKEEAERRIEEWEQGLND